VVLCRFPAKKEKGDIELLQHIACLDVRPQTRTAKKNTNRSHKPGHWKHQPIHSWGAETCFIQAIPKFIPWIHEPKLGSGLPVPPSVCSSPDGQPPPPRVPLPTTSSPGFDRDTRSYLNLLILASRIR
jgi:hypothetical protein